MMRSFPHNSQEHDNPGSSLALKTSCQYIRCRIKTANFFCRKHLQPEEFEIKLSDNVRISPIKLKRNRNGAGSYHENISLAHALYVTPTTNTKMPKGTRCRVDESFQKTILHNNDYLGNFDKKTSRVIANNP